MEALSIIAARLEGLEETIIHRLIDRAQFAANSVAYRPGESGFAGEPTRSLLDIRLLYQERMDAEFGRFHVPEERPFHRELPDSRRTVSLPENSLRIPDFDLVNVTGEILAAYRSFIPRLCPQGDDGQYGSAVEHDVSALQAISRRIHFGSMYVAEAKFRENPSRYRSLIASGDNAAIEELLTRKEVEANIQTRVREKVAHIQGNVNSRVRSVVDADVVLAFYRDTVIPLTRRGEVRYLCARTDEKPAHNIAR